MKTLYIKMKMKKLLLALVITYLPFISSGQWTNVDPPFNSFFNFEVVHDGADGPEIYILFDTSQVLYRFEPGNWENITPEGEWNRIDFVEVDVNGDMLFSATGDTSHQLWTYTNDSIETYDINAVFNLSQTSVRYDSMGRTILPDLANEQFILRIKEDMQWSEYPIPGHWSRFRLYIDDDYVNWHSDSSFLIQLDDTVGIEQLYLFKDCQITQIPLPLVTKSISVVHHSKNKKSFITIRDINSVASFFEYSELGLTQINPVHDLSTVIFLGEASDTTSYFYLKDTAGVARIIRFKNQSKGIDPPGIQDMFSNFYENEENGAIYVSARDTSGVWNFLRSPNRGNTWQQISAPGLDSRTYFLFRDSSGHEVFSYWDTSHTYVRVLKNGAWDNQYTLPKIFIGVDPDVPFQDGSHFLDLLSLFDEDVIIRYENCQFFEEAPDTNLVSDSYDLSLQDDLGRLFYTLKDTLGSRHLFKHESGVWSDLTPPGDWRFINHRFTDTGGRHYFEASRNSDNHDLFFVFQADSLTNLFPGADLPILTGESPDSLMYFTVRDSTTNDWEIFEYDGHELVNLNQYVDLRGSRMDFENNKLYIRDLMTGIFWYYDISGRFDPCTADILLPHHSPLDVTTYASRGSIITAEDIQTPEAYEFRASTEVLLHSGFTVRSGVALNATIESPCDPN